MNGTTIACFASVLTTFGTPALAHPAAAQADTIKVFLLIQMEPERLEKQLESYFRRELRGLGDVTIVESISLADYSAELVGVEEKSTAGTHLGYAVTHGLHRRCDVPKNIRELLPATSGLILAADSATRSNAAIELASFFIDCRIEVSRKIVSVGTSNDWLSDVRAWVAEWDTDFFEEHRRR